MNVYSYVGNNPTNLVDPYGLMAETIAVGGAIITFPVWAPWVAGGAIVVGGIWGIWKLWNFATHGEHNPEKINDGKCPEAKEKTTVIGKLDDLKNLEEDEKSLLDRLPNLGNEKDNWDQNARVLDEEISKGNPIRDKSIDPKTGELRDNTGFLKRERDHLGIRKWGYNPKTRLWTP